MTEEIVALCKVMGAAEDQGELLLPLIRAVVSAMEGRLKPGVAPEDCGAAFPLAAAMVVMDGLERAVGSGKVTSFTAGEVSIRTEGETGRRETRTAQAERLMAPWLGETGFAFRGVAG
ncbi:MAG: hypothetical protein SOZ47_09050 [Lawsonibacter sp.]|nr:hypothetical protein [Lawsonibacter sp.]